MEQRSTLAVLVLAARPKTLWASAAPVFIGCAMAWEHGGFHAPAALCALSGALLIQVGANYANDYFDHVKGADTPGRVGPLRATGAGLVSPRTMRRAAAAAFLLACVPGLYIAWRGGWVYIIIGLLAVGSGVLYTGGPLPFGYVGLGDLFVLVFFGPVAVGGAFHVQTLELTAPALLAGIAAGLFSVAILTVNNLRDIPQDRRAGKKTLAVRFGPAFARAEYVAALATAALGVPVALAVLGKNPTVLLSSLVLVAAAPTIRTVLTRSDGPALNGALAATSTLLLVFSILFSIGWVI